MPDALTPQESKYERAWTRLIGKRLLSAFEKAILDPKLISLRQEIALIDLRITELKERQKKGETLARWQYVNNFAAELEKQATALDGPELKAKMQELAHRLAAVARAGEADYDTWDHVKDLIERRRRLVSTERKYEEMEKLLVPVSQLVLLFNYLHEAILAVIPERSIQRQLLLEVRTRCNGDPHDKKALIPVELPSSYLVEHDPDGTTVADAETVEDE